MYLCISTVIDFNSQNFDPPLMKFDKYSPGYWRAMQFWWAAGSVRAGWTPWRWPYVDVSFYDQVADFQNFLSRSYRKISGK